MKSVNTIGMFLAFLSAYATIAHLGLSSAAIAHNPRNVAVEPGSCVQIVIGDNVGVEFCAHSDNTTADAVAAAKSAVVAPRDNNCTIATFTAKKSHATVISCPPLNHHDTTIFRLLPAAVDGAIIHHE